MLTCTLKELLVALIVPPAYTGCEEILPYCDSSVSRLEQTLCIHAKLYFKVQLKLIG